MPGRDIALLVILTILPLQLATFRGNFAVGAAPTRPNSHYQFQNMSTEAGRGFSEPVYVEPRSGYRCSKSLANIFRAFANNDDIVAIERPDG